MDRTVRKVISNIEDDDDGYSRRTFDDNKMVKILDMDRRMTGFAGFLQDDQVNNVKKRINKRKIFHKDDENEVGEYTLSRKMTLNEVYDK